MLSEAKLKVEIWRQLETAIGLNSQLERSVRVRSTQTE